MKLVFDDPTFSFELIRTLGHSVYGGADLGECLVTAQRVRPNDFSSWYVEWRALAERVHGEADRSAEAGHDVSAREAYLRASNYYRNAEFFLHEDPADPRILDTWQASVDTFRAAAVRLDHPVETVEIPYGDTTLEGYLFLVDDTAFARPTLLVHGGFDSTLEELYFDAGLAALRRGYNCLAFSGPGQGRSPRQQGLFFRPDWEAVITPVVDFAVERPEIDPDRLALLGISLGGMLAPRAAAFEPRLAALVTLDGLFDFYEGAFASRVGDAETLARAARGEDPATAANVTAGLDALMQADTTVRWAITHGMYTYGVDSPLAYIAANVPYTLRGGVAERITCPTLVLDAEDDGFWTGQPQELYDHLTCEKKLIRFSEAEGAGEHCQCGGHALAHQRIFDWLDETLANTVAPGITGFDRSEASLTSRDSRVG